MEYHCEIRSGTTVGKAGTTFATSPAKAGMNMFWRWAKEVLGDRSSVRSCRIFISRKQNAGYEPHCRLLSPETKPVSHPRQKKPITQQGTFSFEERLDARLGSF